MQPILKFNIISFEIQGGREGAPFPLPAPFELYNLNTDPYEENNIIDSWPWLSEFLIARFYVSQK